MEGYDRIQYRPSGELKDDEEIGGYSTVTFPEEEMVIPTPNEGNEQACQDKSGRLKPHSVSEMYAVAYIVMDKQSTDGTVNNTYTEVSKKAKGSSICTQPSNSERSSVHPPPSPVRTGAVYSLVHKPSGPQIPVKSEQLLKELHEQEQ